MGKKVENLANHKDSSFSTLELLDQTREVNMRQIMRLVLQPETWLMLLCVRWMDSSLLKTLDNPTACHGCVSVRVCWVFWHFMNQLHSCYQKCVSIFNMKIRHNTLINKYLKALSFGCSVVWLKGWLIGWRNSLINPFLGDIFFTPLYSFTHPLWWEMIKWWGCQIVPPDQLGVRCLTQGHLGNAQEVNWKLSSYQSTLHTLVRGWLSVHRLPPPWG